MHHSQIGKQQKGQKKKRGPAKKPFKGKACLYLQNTPFGNVVFLETDRRSNFHLMVHPILNDDDFIKNKVKDALMNPDKVYWSNTRFGSLIIYKDDGPAKNPLNSLYKRNYTRVVLDIKNALGRVNPRKVQTAWQIDRIKENKEVKPINGNYTQY